MKRCQEIRIVENKGNTGSNWSYLGKFHRNIGHTFLLRKRSFMNFWITLFLVMDNTNFLFSIDLLHSRHFNDTQWAILLSVQTSATSIVNI